MQYASSAWAFPGILFSWRHDYKVWILTCIDLSEHSVELLRSVKASSDGASNFKPFEDGDGAMRGFSLVAL